MRVRTAVISVITALGLLVAIPATAVADSDSIAWEPCYPQAGPNFECAVVRMPLDHDNPSGTTIPVAIAKLPATDTANRVGSLFLNPGGPGGSGVDFLLGAGPFLFNEEVRSKFDLIGFDPRGVRRSAPLKCFRSNSDLFATLIDHPPFPIDDAEFLVIEAAEMAAVDFCDANARSIIDHMSTADVARDMEAMREMLGDDQLTYYGVSYGSFLGNTYANLFPDKVRAVVIDAVLDPIGWTTGLPGEEDYPFSYRIRSDQGAQDTLDEFFRLCDEAGTSGCALAPDSAERFAALGDELLNNPILIDPGSGEAIPFTYQDLIGSTLGPLYSSGSWPSHAEFLAFIEAGASPATLGAALTKVRELSGFKFPNAPYPGVEQFLGVACSDSDNPDSHADWLSAGEMADANYGYFGSLWTWASSPCAVWNGVAADRYDGPFTANTANPVLVVGNRFDPATRYQGAVIADDLLANSALLTVEGWGHSSLFLSQCADDAIASYLLDVIVPADGATCFQDFSPFDTALTANEIARQEYRAQMMQQIALHPGR